MRARDLDGRRLFIIDDLFDKSIVQMLHETFIRLPFTQSDFDTEDTMHVRHWKFDFQPDGFGLNPVLRTWHQRVTATAAELVGVLSLPIRRIYCNSVGYGDHQHMHFDDKDGTTALYFANAQWIEDWQGETVFYDRAEEACQVVAPRPGRLVVFSSECLHRGGVPSRTCPVPRLTVAFKFAPACTAA